MASTTAPITPEMADIRLQFGISADRAVVAMTPDPSVEQYETIREALPQKSLRNFGYRGTRVSFSILELAVNGPKRPEKLIEIGHDIARALSKRRSALTTHVDEEIRDLTYEQIAENVFFVEEEPAPEAKIAA
jgi:hypothetical protein